MTYLAFVGASLIWGTTFLAIRFGNEAVAPVWAATIRLVLAAILLAIIARLLRQPFPRGAALQGALLFGLCNFGINLSLLYWGELRVPSGVAAVFYATHPLSTGLLAAALGVERLDPRKIAAAVIALGGIATIFWGELNLDVPPEALVSVLVAATAAALSGIFLKRAPRQAAIPANAVGAGVGAVVCLIVSVIVGEDHSLPSTVGGWAPIAYLTVVGSLGAYVIYAWLLARWTVTRASLVGVCAPVIAVFVGAIVKGERPAGLTLLGATIVLGTVIATVRLAPRSLTQSSRTDSAIQSR